MKTEEWVWEGHAWRCKGERVIASEEAQLVLVFGDIDAIAQQEYREQLCKAYPKARIVGASTGGTIESGMLSESVLVASVVAFEHGWVEVAMAENLENATLRERAAQLIESLPKEHLKHVFILMDGLGGLDGSLLVKGINDVAEPFSVTGGLAGDGWQFKRTLVFADKEGSERSAVAVGLYGQSLHVGIGCATGWEEFGAERIVTRSEGNVIHEIDHKPAMKLYEDYLGEYIKDLPGSALRFPLNVKKYAGEKEVVRVMMGIDSDGSILFSGDIPQGSIVRLMKTNVTNLIEGAESAAAQITRHNAKPALAIAVSCSARRSVLKQMVDEELAALAERLGDSTHICGFYSYGEIAPFPDDLHECKLHNQTMTLTVVYED